MENFKILRVKGSTSSISLASTIAHSVYNSEPVSIRAIGAAAVNQAIKALAIAQSYVGAKGLRISVIPGFADVEMEDGTVTAITLRIKVE
jgi:stage V sporulation protein S